MTSTMGAPHLPPCPHCGQDHPEDVLVCPTTDRSLPLGGRLLDGKFRFLVRLGEGGMGSVWKAENVLVHRTVAIKLLHAEYARNENTLRRFRQEATAAGRIRDPHICDILDLGQGVLGPYIVMEMLRGRSLAQLLEQVDRVEPGLAVLISRQALEGLEAAHRVGIVHRDLKPENIFLHEPEPGRLLVKLMDFGISKFAEAGPRQTRQGVLMGTPEYMAPEQAEGAVNVDARTDIWAMGVILYKALTGHDAFLGPTLAATLMKVTLHDPTPLHSFLPEIDRGLEALVMRCLRKNRDDRFASARALWEALASFERLPSAEAVQEVVATGRNEIADDSSPSAASDRDSAPSLAVSERAAATSESWSGELERSKAADSWSGEVAGAMAGDSWTMSGAQLDERPPSALGGGGKSSVFAVFAMLLLVGAGVVAWLLARDDVVVTMTDEAGKGSVAGNDPPERTDDRGSPPNRADVGGREVPVAREVDSAPNVSHVDAPATTGAIVSDSGSAPGDTAAGQDADGKVSTGGAASGGTKSRPRPLPVQVDATKVIQVGSLYAPKDVGPRGRWAAANGLCQKLARERYAGLKGWRLPSATELRRFSERIDRTMYWTRERTDSQAKAVNLFGKTSEKWLDAEETARALCVSSR